MEHPVDTSKVGFVLGLTKLLKTGNAQQLRPEVSGDNSNTVLFINTVIEYVMHFIRRMELILLVKTIIYKLQKTLLTAFFQRS